MVEPLTSAPSPRLGRVVAFGAALFLAAFLLARSPALFDLPVARFLNSFANRSLTLDRFAYAFYWYLSLNSALLMSFIWYCWFRSDVPEKRARVLVGTVMALGATVISRICQYTLPTHSRPIYDAALGYVKPSTLETTKLNTWNSFPSDHTTLLAGLTITLWIVRSPLRVPLIALMALIELSRVYMGAHYPTDLIGATGLALVVIWLTQTPPFIRLGLWAVAQEQQRQALFYGCAFFFCYQMITYFGDLRSFASIVLSMGHWL